MLQPVRQAPVAESQPNSQGLTFCHSPVASQVCSPPSLHLVVPGAQVPPQAPLLQTNGQFWLSIHVPSREQALRVLPSHLVSP